MNFLKCLIWLSLCHFHIARAAVNLTTWFDSFISPYYNNSQIDAFGFAYYQDSNQIQFYKTIGKCYDLNQNVVSSSPDPYTSLFRVGSVTKVMVAVGVLQLYERGKLQLTDPVVNLVPSLAGLYSSQLTVLDTLRFTTGVDERILNLYIPGDGIVESSVDEAKLLFTKNLADPGSRVSYSNLGVTVAGAVIESVSGIRLIEYLQNNIGSPLNITSMYFHTDLKGDYSKVCYPRASAGMEPYQIRTAASGDLYISLDGYSKFIRAVMNQKGLFQSNATADMMKAKVYPLSSTNIDGMGYILSIEKYRNLTVYSKDGGVFDFTSYAAFVEETQESFFSVATNGPNYSPDFIAEKLVYDYLNDNYPNNSQPNFNFPVDTSDNVIKNVLPAIAGQYLGTRGGQLTPLKILYLLSASFYSVTDGSINGPRGFTYYPMVNPSIPDNQLLLQADCRLSTENRTHYILATFTDATRTRVKQLEDFTFLSTDLPSTSDWTLNQVTVFSLFAFDILSQLIGAISPFIMLCLRFCPCRCKSSSPVDIGSVALFAFISILSWMSLAFYVAVFLTPFPEVYFKIHPSFIAIQVIALLRILFLAIMFVYVCRQYFAVKDGRSKITVTLCGLWFSFQIIGIPGLFALNLITFTLW